VTLDPLDGRIQWSPDQVGTVIWFAHGIDDSGFPTVRCGEINAADNSVNTAEAFHAGDSDDFDPSIGVEPDGPGSFLAWVWVNWAYTQSAEGVAASDAVNGGGGSPARPWRPGAPPRASGLLGAGSGCADAPFTRQAYGHSVAFSRDPGHYWIRTDMAGQASGTIHYHWH
jgi:hypothetical protein